MYETIWFATDAPDLDLDPADPHVGMGRLPRPITAPKLLLGSKQARSQTGAAASVVAAVAASVSVLQAAVVASAAHPLSLFLSTPSTGLLAVSRSLLAAAM